jgi:Bacterial PH domain/Short C-terminal domain
MKVVGMAAMDDLIPGEEVVFITEKHWIAPVRDSLVAGLLLIGAFVVGMISPESQEGITGFVRNLLDLLRIGLFIVGIGWIAYNIVVWRTAKFAVTNRRVLREEGLASRRSSATMLTSVTDVQSRVSFLGGRLGYGDLVILTQSGESGVDRFSTIRDPKQFRDQMLTAKLGGDGAGQAGQRTEPVAAAAPPVAPAAAAPPPVAPPADHVQTLARLAELRDSGAITLEEFEAKKAEILSRI